MARNYAALPYEYLEEMELLSDEEFGRLCRALLAYSSTGETTELEGAERYQWKRVQMQEDRFRESYNETSKTLSEAGKRGAAKRWGAQSDNAQTAAEDSQAIAPNGQAIGAISTPLAPNGESGNTETDTETDTNNSLSNDRRVNKARAARFVPPTLEEVAAYKNEIGSPIDPQDFIDFYGSKGWKVGKDGMKDWKAAFRRAAKWDKYKNTAPPTKKYAQPTTDDYERMKRMYEKLQSQ